MQDYKTGKWAAEIIAAQKDDGSWGNNFHSLSMPVSKQPLTTEQALGRLRRLGFTKEDPIIKKALSYLQDCLTGKKTISDTREKRMDFDIFASLMFAVWIRRFTRDDLYANDVANKWKFITAAAVQNGYYEHDTYIETFYDIMKPKYGTAARTRQFFRPEYYYLISIMAGEVDKSIEKVYFDYIMNSEKGYYYGHDGAVTRLPKSFCTKAASAYLSAIELYCEHPNRYYKDKMKFVVDWLNSNKNVNGKWDMSAAVKDGSHFPLSDSWRTAAYREQDCTYRINKIIFALE